MTHRLSLGAIATAAMLLAGAQFAGANNFTINSASTSAQSLASGESGTVGSSGSLTISSGVAVTFSGSNGTRTLVNNGTISQTGTSRALRSTSSGQTLNITNNGTIESKGDDTFQLNANSAVTLNNYGIIRNNGTDAGQAIDWNGITGSSNTLNNYSTGSITTTGADTVRLGVNGVLNNAGTISATPYQQTPGVVSGSDGVDMQDNSGAQIFNTGSGLISGRHGISGGDTKGVSLSISNALGATIRGVNGSGINIDFSTSFATIENRGTIEGRYDPTYTAGDGDGVDVDGTVNLTNYGTIRGLGAAGVNATDGGTNNAEGVSIGGGTIVNHEGAEISGNNTNGTAGRLGNGILVDNSNDGAAYAATSITNYGTIRGYSGFAIKMVGTWNDTITNNATGTIQGAGGGAAIQSGAGADTVTNRGAIIGGNGLAIALEDGNDTLNIEGGSVSGDISGGNGTDTVNLNLGTGNAFTYSGSLSDFEQVNVLSGTTTLSGVSTYGGATTVSEGAALALNGAGRLSSSSSLQLDGGTLSFAGIDAANGQHFATISLTGDSVIALNGTTTVSFGTLASYDGSSVLTITGFDVSLGAPAIRFDGDLTADAGFLAFLDNVTIDGQSVQASFDGSQTQIGAVPEPSTYALLALSLAAIIVWRMRTRRAQA